MSQRPRRFGKYTVNYIEDSEDDFQDANSTLERSALEVNNTPQSPQDPSLLLNPDVQSVEDLLDQTVQQLEAMSFEEENGTDGADALAKAIASLAKHAWEPNDMGFWFNQAEIKMQQAGVKKQFTKLQALSTCLPREVIDDIKPFLRKKETDYPDKNAYLLTKTHILDVFGQAVDAAFDRAMARVLTGKPSQLARQLVDDLCEHELDGCCCSKFIGGLWRRQLPSGVKQQISDIPFDKDNFGAICKKADKVYSSTRPSTEPKVAAIAPAVPSAPAVYDEAFHESWSGLPQDPEVAAVGYGRGQYRGGRGGRGQRGGQRGRGGRGQPANRGQGGQGRGGNQNQNQGQSNGQRNQSQQHNRHKTQRHADLPPFETCFRHWTYGKSAHFCMEPGTCPWKDFWTPKANN